MRVQACEMAANPGSAPHPPGTISIAFWTYFARPQS